MRGLHYVLTGYLEDESLHERTALGADRISGG